MMWSKEIWQCQPFAKTDLESIQRASFIGGFVSILSVLTAMSRPAIPINDKIPMVRRVMLSTYLHTNCEDKHCILLATVNNLLASTHIL